MTIDDLKLRVLDVKPRPLFLWLNTDNVRPLEFPPADIAEKFNRIYSNDDSEEICNARELIFAAFPSIGQAYVPVLKASNSAIETAARQVADALALSPEFALGDGEVTIILKPDILDGSTFHVRVSSSLVDVRIEPATACAEATFAHALPSFERFLAERCPARRFTFSLDKSKDSKSKNAKQNQK